MRLPATSTRLAPAPTAVDSGRADTLFRLAAAWRACPKAAAAAIEDGKNNDAHVGPLFRQSATPDDQHD
jgi:hypothetical protein